jgi:hypothetical protein
MNAIKIHTHLDSDTIRLPELRPMVGKDVEIIVIEEASTPKRDLSEFFASAGRGLVDADAVRQLREISKI